MKKRLLSLLICLCMALTLLPTAVLAAGSMYIDREPSGRNGYTFEVTYSGTEPVSYQWYRPEGGQANFTVIDVGQTPGENEIGCDGRWSGSCANGVWSSDSEHKIDVRFPAYAGDTVQIQITGGAEVTVKDFDSKQSYEDKGSGLYSFVVQKTGDSNPEIASTAAFTATITVQRQWDALEGETQAALQTREPGEYFCIATAGTASKVSETVTIGPAVVRLDYTEGGTAKAASFTEDELQNGVRLSTLLGENADADTPATLTVLADSMADLGLDRSVTLTSGDGGPYTLTRDPEEYQMMLLEVTAPVTVTNLLLDGSVTEPKSSEAPRFIEVSGGSLTLGDGATVQNCQPNTKHKKQPPAAVYVSSGSLIMESGSKIVNNQSQMGGVVREYGADVSLSGNVTIQGNEALDINTGATVPANLVVEAATPKARHESVQVTGALTGGEKSIGITLVDSVLGPQPTTGPVVEGAAGYQLSETDLAAFFSDRPGYFLKLDTDDNTIYLKEYAITTQPTAEVPTVAVNQTKDAAYQWYPATLVTEDITDQNTVEGTYPCTYADGKWTAGMYDGDKGWFTLDLKKGDIITVTVAEGETIPTDDGLCLNDLASGEMDSVSFQPDKTVYTLTAPADGTYTLEPFMGNTVPVISATVTHAKLGAAVSGQTTDTLTAPAAGDYLCQVTYPDGTVLQSDLISVAAAPHKHALSVDCETEGDDLVTFDKALTSVDGKLYVDGAEVPSELINMSGVDMTQYQLPSGHYYLADDVTLADKSYLFFGTDGSEDADVVVDLCLNGHVLDLGGSHSRMSVAGSAQLRVCDCGDGGAVRGAYTSNERLGAMVNVTGVLELYGGAVENTATPGQDEQARAVALFMGVATLHGGQVIAGHDVALQYDTSAAGLTLYDGVTLQGGADMAEVWLSDVLGYGDDPLLTIAQPLTKPSTPWRLASSKARTLTDGWATHMADADFNDYFTCIDQGRCAEKTDSGELALADYAITAQPSKANGYTVAANGAPSGYQWYKATAATAEITDQNATPYEYITGSIAPASYENGKWTAAQSSEAPEAAYFTVALQKGDRVTLTLDQLPTQGQLGLYAYGKGQLWCYFGGSREPDEGVSIDGSVITYVIPADGDYKLMLDGLGYGLTAPTLAAQLTHVTLGDAVSGQTANKLTAAPEGTYLCRVSWADGTTADSDVVSVPHSHAWGKWTLQADKETLTRTCVGNAAHTESQTLSYGLPNAPIVYDGAEKKPAPSLKTDGSLGALTLGTDYTVAYADNVNAGTGTVTVTGTGNFDFTLEVTFTIQKADQIAPAGIFTITDVAVGQTQGAIAVAGNPSNLEYRLKPEGGSDPAWTPAAASNPLPAGTYEFRYKATANYNASPATSLQVRVLSPEAKALTIAQGIEHGTVTKRRDLVNPGDTVTLAVKPQTGYELASLTATYGEGRTITPTVSPDDPQLYTFTMPDADVTVTATFAPIPTQGDVTGKVEVKPGTPDVDVDEEALKDLAGEVSDGDTVTVKLTVEAKDDPADKEDIQAVVAGDKANVLYLDLSLLKQVNDGDPETITNTGDKVLEIAVDYDFTGKKDVTVYRKHGENDAEKLTRLTARPSANLTDGSFYADSRNGVVYIYASKFSTYAIAYTKETTSPSRPSGGRPGTVGTTTTAPAWPFTDVKTTDACYEAVKYVYEKGWMLGTSETTFAPNGQLTRSMLATVLYRMAGSPKVEGSPEFTDTQAGAWYADAVVWAAQTQVLRGYGNGQFGPEDPVSQEMLNMVMGRLKGEDPAWVGDSALAAPATRAQIAQVLAQQ